MRSSLVSVRSGNGMRACCSELGYSVTTVSRRGGGDYTSIASAVAAARPEYAVIATETAHHAESLARTRRGRFSWNGSGGEADFCTRRPGPGLSVCQPFRRLQSAFPSRHDALAERLRGRQAITVSAYVGQDIRDWRPGRDHRTTASATQEAGGGVLRDLSHELDYLLWLFGPWHRVAALGGSSGSAADRGRRSHRSAAGNAGIAGGAGAHGLSGPAGNAQDTRQPRGRDHRSRHCRWTTHRQWRR